MLSEQHHEGPNVLNPATTAMIGHQATCMVVGHFSRNCWAAVPAAKGKYFASWEQGLRLIADFKSSVLVAHFTIPKTVYIQNYQRIQLLQFIVFKFESQNVVATAWPAWA